MTDMQAIGERWRTRIILPRDKEFHEQMVLEAAYGLDEASYPPGVLDRTIQGYTADWGQSWDVGRIVMGEDFSSAGAAWGRRLEVISEERAARWPLPIDIPEVAVAVVPQKRGKGAGSVALKSVMRDYRDMGVSEAGLHVVETNLPALKLYRRIGFEPVAYCVNTADNERGFIMVADLETAPID